MRFAVVCFVIALGGLGIWCLPTWTQSEDSHCYLQDGRVFDTAQVAFLLEKFASQGVQNAEEENGKIRIASRYRTRCNDILASPEFTKVTASQDDSSAGLFKPFMSSREKEQIAKKEKIKQLEELIARLTGANDVEILYSEVRSKGFARKDLQTAAVTLWAKEGNVINPLQAATVRQILCKSFAGMEEIDVLVVDGDTGTTFKNHTDPSWNSAIVDSQRVIESQRELESTRKQIEVQSQKMLAAFGEPQVVVRMDLEKRIIQIVPRPDEAPKETTQQTSSVTANGVGAITTRKSREAAAKKQPATKVVNIKRLLGIEVLVPRSVVTKYIHEQFGVEQEVTEEQFSRGTVSIRNEITKQLVRWLRSQQGIEIDSDLVTVSIASDENIEESTPASQEQFSWKPPLVPALATTGVLVAIGLLALSWKSRSPRRSRNSSGQVSGGGRDFVVRNQTNTGRELADEANEVVHAAPANSARAFQNLVAGENR